MNDIRQFLMDKHCPNLSVNFTTGQPLARVESPQVIEAEYTAIAPAYAPMPTQQTEFAALTQKLDSHHQFVADGFTHLVTQGQSFDARLSQLEQRQAPAPIAQYQAPDISPALLAIAQQNQQTQLAMYQMASAMQRLSDRPTVINHSTHNETRNVIVHGNNYGNICNGDQKNGGAFLWYIFGVVGLIILGAQIYGK